MFAPCVGDPKEKQGGVDMEARMTVTTIGIENLDRALLAIGSLSYVTIYCPHAVSKRKTANDQGAGNLRGQSS